MKKWLTGRRLAVARRLVPILLAAAVGAGLLAEPLHAPARDLLLALL